MAARRRTRNPKGGLTQAGRDYFHRKEGAELKPGIKKSARDMKLSEMRRKGSWATRFYGRKKLPPLQDAEGRPTRLAFTDAVSLRCSNVASVFVHLNACFGERAEIFY